MSKTDFMAPPEPPIPPQPIRDDATPQEKSAYMAEMTSYRSRLTVFRTANARYKKHQLEKLAEPDDGIKTYTEHVPEAPVEVTIPALPAPTVVVEFEGNEFSRPATINDLNTALSLAILASLSGAQAGDYRWHGGEEDFCWLDTSDRPVPMDAETFIEFSKTVFNTKA